jgi:hypothetical protein
MPVSVCFLPISDDVVIPVFRPTAADQAERGTLQ